MTQKELRKTLRQHAAWLNCEPGGKRADLRAADLTGADLRGADLRGVSLMGADLTDANLTDVDLTDVDLTDVDLMGTRGNGREIRSLHCSIYDVTYTATDMQIGCRRYPIDRWWAFTEDEIERMELGIALAWWRTWGPILLRIVAAAPAVPHGGMKERDQ